MTDERIWNQASIGERVEWIKVRLDRMDRAFDADRQKIEALFKANEVVVGRNCDLARRVAELENGPSQFGCVSGFTAGSEGPRHEYVECGELARLRRIEEAAREVDSWDPHLCGVNDDRMLQDLRRLKAALRSPALDSEPKR